MSKTEYDLKAIYILPMTHNNTSDNGLVPAGKKPLCEPLLTNIFVVI